jgi:hypothetical protein
MRRLWKLGSPLISRTAQSLFNVPIIQVGEHQFSMFDVLSVGNSGSHQKFVQ